MPPHSLGKAFDDLDRLFRGQVRRDLDAGVDVDAPMGESADIGNGAVGDEHLLIVEIEDLREAQADFLDPANDDGEADDFHHVTDIHGIREDQRQADDHVLDQALGTEADGQRGNATTGQVAGETDAELLQEKTKREKVDQKGHGIGQEPDQGPTWR